MPASRKTGGTITPMVLNSTRRPMDLPNTLSTRSTPPAPVSNRDLRQRGLIPPARLTACHAVVIGVGAIGRQVALQLAAVGIPLLVLYDHDTVEEANLAPQGYRPDQLACCKVDATAADCQRLNP